MIILTADALLGRCSSCRHNGVGALSPLCDVPDWWKNPYRGCRFHEPVQGMGV